MGSIPTFTQENEMNSANDVQLNDLKSSLLGAMHDGIGPSADASDISEGGGIRCLSPITHIGEGKACMDLPRGTHAELVCCGVFKDFAGWSPPPNPEGDYPLCSWLFRCRGRGCESRSIRSISVFRTEESVGLGRTPRLALRTQSDVWKNPQSELPSGSRLLAVLRVAPLHRKVREASWIMAPKEGSMARPNA